MTELKRTGFGTKAVHAGVEPDPSTGALMTPIYQNSTYIQTGVGNHKGYEYSRTHNPTRTALQHSLAALENGKHGIAFSSGLGAIDAVAKLLNPGDEVVSVNDLYGGSYRLFTTVFERYGIKFSFVDLSKADSIQEHLTEKTKLVWVETPTNPTMTVVDIEAIVRYGHSVGAVVAVDNTFATPYLQNPLDFGADIVMHSVTKYLGGHSDVVMGALIVKDDNLADQLYTIQNNCGAIPGPMDCFLVLRGVKTLHLRVQRHSENGMAIAQFLKKHDAVDTVYYPGLEDHPNHDIAKKQMRAFGGMVAFTLKDDSLERAHEVVKNMKLFSLAESLGGVESLVSHPATMTHASIPKEKREKVGVTDSLIRLSVGVEDISDLIADLSQALQ